MNTVACEICLAACISEGLGKLVFRPMVRTRRIYHGALDGFLTAKLNFVEQQLDLYSNTFKIRINQFSTCCLVFKGLHCMVCDSSSV